MSQNIFELNRRLRYQYDSGGMYISVPHYTSKRSFVGGPLVHGSVRSPSGSGLNYFVTHRYKHYRTLPIAIPVCITYPIIEEAMELYRTRLTNESRDR